VARSRHWQETLCQGRCGCRLACCLCKSGRPIGLKSAFAAICFRTFHFRLHVCVSVSVAYMHQMQQLKHA
jgi:hypothetical protein